jgi:hypothetical protein
MQTILPSKRINRYTFICQRATTSTSTNQRRNGFECLIILKSRKVDEKHCQENGDKKIAQKGATPAVFNIKKTL